MALQWLCCQPQVSRPESFCPFLTSIIGAKNWGLGGRAPPPPPPIIWMGCPPNNLLSWMKKCMFSCIPLKPWPFEFLWQAVFSDISKFKSKSNLVRRGYRIFWRGGGGGVMATRGGGWSAVIAPVGEKLLFEHTKFSATRGGWSPLPPPVSATVSDITSL